MSTKQDARRKEALMMQNNEKMTRSQNAAMQNATPWSTKEREEYLKLIAAKSDPMAVYVGYFGLVVLVGMVAAAVCVMTGVL